MMKVRMIEQRDNGVCLFELKNDEIKVITSNLGCHVLSVFTKDREGNFGDVVLGFENVEDCWHGDGSYMGAIAGRVANRIGDAKFELNGRHTNWQQTMERILSMEESKDLIKRYLNMNCWKMESVLSISHQIWKKDIREVFT